MKNKDAKKKNSQIVLYISTQYWIYEMFFKIKMIVNESKNN